jgi:hypothetical protein
MPIDPEALSSLASDYAKDMTSIRGRRVQRLLKREFAGAEYVYGVKLGDGRWAILGVSSSGAALCATDGRGPHACVFKWRHGSAHASELRFDLLKDSLPVLATGQVPLSALRNGRPMEAEGGAGLAPEPAPGLLLLALRALE